MIKRVVGNEAEALHVAVFSKQRRALERELWLLQREKPRVGQQIASLRGVVVALTLVVGPVLRQPHDFRGPLDLRYLKAVVNSKNHNHHS